MGQIKNHYWDEILGNEKFDELVNEAQEEQEFQEHLDGGEICQGGECRYCEEEGK